MADNFIQSSNTTPKIPEANDSPTVLKLAGEPQNTSTTMPESTPNVDLSNVDLATVSSPPIVENVGSPWKNKQVFGIGISCVSDNVTQEPDLKLELQIDGGNWKTITPRVSPGAEARYEECLTGSAGQSHTGTLKVTDKRGNTATASNTMSF